MNNIEKALANFPNDITNFINNLTDERFKDLKKGWDSNYDTYFDTKEEYINFYINETDYTFEDFLEENCHKDYNEKHNKAYNTFLIEKYVFFWEYMNRHYIKSLEKDFHSAFYIDKSQKIKDTVRNEICYPLVEEKETLLGNTFSVCLVYPYNCNYDEVHILHIRNNPSSVFANLTDALYFINKLDETNGYIFIEE